MAPRFAIYFVPPRTSPLAQFGASAIGYDIWQNAAVPLLPLEAYADTGDALTAEPRRYGFHATLKAPFHLKAGASDRELEAHVARFASQLCAVSHVALEVRSLSRFIALVPSAPPGELATMAAQCVEEFDAYRAPLSDFDRARRLSSRLTGRQQEYLETWGYPYVFDEFRFHMTLAGPAESDLLPTLQKELDARWAAIAAPVAIDSIALVVQPSRDQPFHVQACYPLKPAAAG